MIHLQFWELRELFTRLLVERDSTLMFNCLICIFRVETNRKINYSCSPSSLRVQRAAWRWLMKLKQKKEVYSIKVANRMRRARGAVCCLRRWTAKLEKLNKTTTTKKSIAQPATTKWNVSVRSYEIGVQQARSKARELVRPRNPFGSASFTLLNLECWFFLIS